MEMSREERWEEQRENELKGGVREQEETLRTKCCNL